MKTGRNDPCPCGSGKKYKKCCLEKDQEANARRPLLPTSSPKAGPAAPTRSAPPAAPRTASLLKPPPEPLDPAMEKINARWEEFQAADSAGRLAVYLKTIDDPELMDDEMAFEMLSRLYADVVKSGERSHFDEWVAVLRHRRPEVYDEGAHYYLSWSLESALAEGRTESVRTLSLELAAHAGRDIDIVHRSLEALAYHGQLSILVEALRIAWPHIKSSSNVTPWGVSELAEEGSAYEIYHYLEHTPAPDLDDPVLLEPVRFFFDDPNMDFLRQFIGDVTGRNAHAWKLGDFALRPRRKRHDDWDEDEEEKEERPDPGAENLIRLIAEFIGYLRRQEGVPFPRGQLMRKELARYFFRRHEGELDPQLSMMEAALHPDRKLPKPPPPIHPLCPERITLEVCLAKMMGFLNGLYYRSAALFEIVPAWLRFLEFRGLIDAQTRAKVIANLRPLHAELLRTWEEFRDDPAVLRAALRWPEDAAKGLPEAPKG
jgi:hypothetical protein